jgi:hypothetical protein
MTFGCLWCSKRFIRGREAQDAIDFTVYEPRSSLQAEAEIRKLKFAQPKEHLVAIDRDYVIPPILHAKIKIGNDLFDRLLGTKHCIQGGPKKPAFLYFAKILA